MSLVRHRAGESFLRRAVVLPFVALLLALGLTFAPAHTAQAFSGAEAALVKEGVTKSLARSTVARTFCAGGPVFCAVANLGALAFAVYGTKDLWLPIFQGGGSPEVDNGGGGPVDGAYEVQGSAEFAVLSAQTAPWPGDDPIIYEVQRFPGVYVHDTYTNWGYTYTAQCRSTVSGSEWVSWPEQAKVGIWRHGAPNVEQWGNVCEVNSPAGESSSDWEVVGFDAAWSGSYQRPQAFTWGASTGSEPATFVQTSVTCQSPDGQTVQVIVSANSEGQVVVPSCIERLGPGWTPISWGIDGGTSEGNAEPLLREEVASGIPSLYPSCTGLGSTGCVLRVEYLGEPCQVGQAGCTDWTRNLDTRQDSYRCMWGPYSMPLSDCYVLERAYQTDVARTVTVDDPAAVDGDPATVPAPGTGTNPEPVPGTGTGTLTLPDTYPDNYPGAAGDAPAAAEEGGECFPTGWGVFNPLGWVYKPVRCALEWAFVPQTPLSTRVQRVQTAYSDTPPGRFVDALYGSSSPWGQTPGAAACPDWRISVGSVDSPVICGTSFSDSIVGGRGWLAAGAVAAAFAPLARGFLRGSVPIIKPTGGD